jgi:hypothetical protein
VVGALRTNALDDEARVLVNEYSHQAIPVLDFRLLDRNAAISGATDWP